MTGPFGDRLESALDSMVPIVEWVPNYNPSWLRRDVLAGITVTASVIPEGLAYASLANMPPVTGLYAGLLATAAYVFFGTSRQVIFGPTSALAILLAASVGSVATGGTAAYAALVFWTTVLVGVFAVVAWLFQLGFLVHFISDAVLTGFSTGAALYIMSTQLGPLFGIDGASGVFFERLAYVGAHLGATNPPTLFLGVVAIAILALGEWRFPRLPTALIVVLASILLLTVTDFQQQGIAIVGQIPSGLPSLTIPAVPSLSTIRSLIPIAGALFLLSYVQGIGAIETFARENDYDIDANQELLSTGVANLAAGLGGGFAVGGSMSRSALNDAVGGKTQVTSAIVAGALVVVLVFLTGIFTNLPEAVLAAVVIVAVTSLIDLSGLRRLYTVSTSEFAIAVAVLVAVLAFGMLWGVLIGVVLSMLNVIAHVTVPVTSVLGRIPGTGYFVEQDRHPEAKPVQDVFVYRVEAPLFYANAPTVRDDLLTRVDAEETAPSLVVFDLISSPSIDVTAAEMLKDLHNDLQKREIDLRVAGADPQVARVLRATGLEQTIGQLGDEEPVVEVIQRWKQDTTD
ncbi:SulP family inorganic anion transporter [Natrinema limicola]|uniref:Sulfate transporter n=1 Tax=Natrinema limicola JCM 13563 TaxID=1230457 RepID=M0C670_9EURY|nr:SulP family inorganic anion transporter [Natrinema limicola]ELZ17419.1 sulfate transporter [Natrinema limicola JCM 13563]